MYRQRTNFAGNPYVIRFGGNLCGNGGPIGDMDIYNDCLTSVTDYVEFWDCYNRGVHSFAHTGVGGTIKAYVGQQDSTRPPCFNFGGAFTIEINNIRKYAYSYGCYDCPQVGDCEYGTDDPFECGACDVANGTCMIQDVTVRVRLSFDLQQMVGDFIDTATSPNDPLFIFHHGLVYIV